jgi:hypothetical protein
MIIKHGEDWNIKMKIENMDEKKTLMAWEKHDDVH